MTKVLEKKLENRERLNTKCVSRERKNGSFDPAIETNPADSAEGKSKPGASFRDILANNVVSSGSPYRGCRTSGHSKSSYTQSLSCRLAPWLARFAGMSDAEKDAYEGLIDSKIGRVRREGNE